MSLRYFGSIFFSPEFDVQNLTSSLSFSLNTISISKLSFSPTTMLRWLIETHGYLTHQHLSMTYSQTSEHLCKATQEHFEEGRKMPLLLELPSCLFILGGRDGFCPPALLLQITIPRVILSRGTGIEVTTGTQYH